MAKSPSLRRVQEGRGRDGNSGEWVGGIVQPAAYVTGEGEPYPIEVLLWVDEQRLVLSAETGRVGELTARAGELLEPPARPDMPPDPKRT